MTPLLLTPVHYSYHSDKFDMNKAVISHLPCLDTNEDGVLDEQELEALFTKEVQTVHHVILKLKTLMKPLKIL